MSVFTVKQAQERVGSVLRNKWTVDKLIGIGGMACVYAATHRNGKRVAIKMLHPGLVKNADICDRFLREGYASNAVGHPNAPSVLDDDRTDDGAVFLVMELLEGEGLDIRLEARQTLEATEVLYIADQVLDVLAAAHDKGVIHRDIKPANIFLCKDGAVKVLDFGLARMKESGYGGQVTRDGIVIGTASYMPPEQAHAKRNLVDARSDLWAVGATMFHALTGRFVHHGGTTMDRLIAAMKKPAPSLASVAPDLPASLVAVVDRSLMFNKEDRWPDARTMQFVARGVFAELTSGPQSSPGRVSLSHVPAWVPGNPNASDLSSIDVSVVYDPNPTDSLDVPVDTVRDPDQVVASMDVAVSVSEDLAEVTDSMFEEVSPAKLPKPKA
jgi:serine/threonine-protein kinase